MPIPLAITLNISIDSISISSPSLLYSGFENYILVENMYDADEPLYPVEIQGSGCDQYDRDDAEYFQPPHAAFFPPDSL